MASYTQWEILLAWLPSSDNTPPNYPHPCIYLGDSTRKPGHSNRAGNHVGSEPAGSNLVLRHAVGSRQASTNRPGQAFNLPDPLDTSCARGGCHQGYRLLTGHRAVNDPTTADNACPEAMIEPGGVARKSLGEAWGLAARNLRLDSLLMTPTGGIRSRASESTTVAPTEAVWLHRVC